MISEESIKELFSDWRIGPRNHIITTCPFCNKEGHMYIRMTTTDTDKYGKNKSFNWDCKKCGENGRIYKLLIQLGATHLIQGQVVDLSNDLSFTNGESEEVKIDLEVPTIKMPLGFRRSYDDEYLKNKRGFRRSDFKKYTVGRTDLVTKLEDYVFIAIEEDKEIKGYVGRNTRDDDRPKYRNSKDNEFSKLLLGYDEINFLTETVILVEGFFDKKAIDDHFHLDNQHEIKCCATFGKKVSLEQMMKLMKKNIKNIILVYDPDALKDSKKFSFELEKFFSVLVGYTRENDLDDSTFDEIEYAFSHLETPMEFYLNKIPRIQL